jgi:hypothetical protein
MAKLRVAAVSLASLIAGLDPVWASGNFLCEADDQSLKFSAESTFSHGLGEVFTDFRGVLDVHLKGAPVDLASLEFDGAHLTHHWFSGDDLKLHIYREREGNEPHGYVELVVETKQNPDNETDFRGTYKLTVYDTPAGPTGEGETLTATGSASCSVG